MNEQKTNLKEIINPSIEEINVWLNKSVLKRITFAQNFKILKWL
jgi:hypothetical protein